MRRHLPLLLMSLLSLAFMVGCVSPERLLNLTPLTGGDGRNTVNLWPLCYGDDECFSVLWPVFDADPDGFALRPLIFNEGKEWGILWPISDIDEDYFRLLNIVISKDDGFGIIPLFWIDRDMDFYQFLLGYKDDEAWGVFPFLHHGEYVNFLFPLFINYHDDETKRLITPVSYFSPTFNYFTLAWWNRENGHFGFYPLFHVGKEGHRFLLWWKSPNSTGLFPVYICAKDFAAAGPVWWSKSAWGVFPVCRFGEESSYCLTWWKTKNTTGLFPIYLKTKESTLVGPVWWSKGENRSSLGMFPLFSCSSDDNEKAISLLCHILGGYEGYSLYNSTADGQAQLAQRGHAYDWLCHLGKKEVASYSNGTQRRYFRMWPLFDCTSTTRAYPSDEEKIFDLNVLFGGLCNYNCPSRYTWSGEMADECRELFNLIQEVTKSDLETKRKSIFDPLKKKTARRLINDKCQLLGLEPIDQLTHESLDALANDLELKYPRSLVKDPSFGMFLDIIDYEREDDKTTFKLLWGALSRHESSPELTEDTILWRAFRQVTTPTTTSREIFPFISYYHDKKEDATVFSFAWRLFRRETSPEGDKLWLFFIPFQ